MPTIRPARSEDAERLAHLGRETFVDTFGHLYRPDDLAAFLAQTYAPDVQARELACANTCILLAEHGAEAVGYIKLGPCKLPVDDLPADAMEVQRLYIRHIFQKSGLGARLMQEGLNAIGVNVPLYLGVWENNHGAQRFYGRFGFRPVGNYWFYVGSHADREVIMKRECDLVSTPANL